MSPDGNLLLFTIVHCIIGILIAVGYEILHEYCHYFRAKQLGYKATMDLKHACTSVDITDENPIDKMKIARAPYMIVLPLAFSTLIIGIYFLNLGLAMGSALTIFFHMMMYQKEGVDEEPEGEDINE